MIARLAMLDRVKDKSQISGIMKEICGGNRPEINDSYFSVRDEGVWFSKPNGDGEDPETYWICSKLNVTAYSKNLECDSWWMQLDFYDHDGDRKNWLMPMDLLAGDGIEVRKELLKRGLKISQQKKARLLLLDYLQSINPQTRIQSVDRIGWHDDRYILPTCADHTRLIFALSAAFCPPVLNLREEEGGGIHFVGASSIGKTLALRIAGSVWGGGGISGFMGKWRSTVNGLELLAKSRCDSLLLLDEIAEIPAKEAAAAAYMLANGSGKKRLDRNGCLLPSHERRVLFLSSGGVSLENPLTS